MREGIGPGRLAILRRANKMVTRLPNEPHTKWAYAVAEPVSSSWAKSRDPVALPSGCSAGFLDYASLRWN